ncbi:MAG: glucose/mannose-6-phosphate isomerase, partial [Solirubrobacteraceae bacterium]|nr:glucose/mannose-6-phosphate isomerase [Solirubrobacteraceae bacterium]
MPSLTADALRGADPTGQLAEVLDLPAHLRDALWRVDSAGLAPRASAGLVIAGMGGSAVGGALARAALGDRERKPIVLVRDYALPAWVDESWSVLLSSYSGSTEETLACWDAATAAGAHRVVSTTGGPLAERARADRVAVIPLPGGFQPRAAVGYATVVALEVAALAGVGPSLRDEVEAAAGLIESLAAEWGPQAPDDAEPKALAAALQGRLPVFTGAGLTAPVAYRWKCQVNENANRAAFWSELPEADHNEIEGWGDRSVLEPVFLEDPVDTHPRVLERFELTARIIGGATRVRARGETRLERQMSLVHLGDLVSIYLAALDGTDPAAIPALLQLK